MRGLTTQKHHSLLIYLYLTTQTHFKHHRHAGLIVPSQPYKAVSRPSQENVQNCALRRLAFSLLLQLWSASDALNNKSHMRFTQFSLCANTSLLSFSCNHHYGVQMQLVVMAKMGELLQTHRDHLGR